MLSLISRVPKRLWLLPLACIGLTVLSIAEGGERSRASRAPAAYGTPIYASKALSNPVAAQPEWVRSSKKSYEREMRADQNSLSLLAVSIDREGEQREVQPDSVRRVYFRR